jgi:hypothetical protein
VPIWFVKPRIHAQKCLQFASEIAPQTTVSFLNNLKQQASALQEQQQRVVQDLSANVQNTEAASRMASKYVQDLCAQLNVLHPAAPGNYSLDGKTAWPALQLREFRADARKKLLRDQEVHDYMGLGWKILPSTGKAAMQRIVVNFPPDLERVQQRLSYGQIKHERKEQRHPDTNKLQAYVFEYETASFGSIVLTPEHDSAQIHFRVLNVGGFNLLSTSYSAAQVNSALMDELAKLLVGQPSRFG